MLWCVRYSHSCTIPFPSQNLLKSLDLYSLPPSIIRTFKLFSACLSTHAHNFSNIENTSPFSFSKYTHIFLENSSTKVRKYPLPPSDGLSNRPHTSKCTTSNTFLARFGAKVLKTFLGCFLITQPSQALAGC